MKKSTLITTIAMIVVVVVALSTATYAWFSSGSATTVTGQMTTDARNGWIIYGGTATTNSESGATTITYTSTAPVLHLMNELYSPVAAISPTLTADGLSATYTQTKFYKATQVGIGMLTTAEASLPAYVHQEVAAGPDVDNLNYMRIINNTETQTVSDNLQLTIYIYVTDSTVSTALIAGKRFSTFIVTDAGHYNTRYYRGGVEGTLATRAGLEDATDDVTYSTAGNPAVNVTADSALATAGYTLVGQEAVTLPDSTELTSGAAYYTITINLGSVNKAASRSIAFYSWFDGWALDNTAAGGAVNILYSFATQE
ncbi:MAG: hypothetical protein E7338_06875 [Clostridiales bacterium]|nr:hypothetical protein [Clostridiales bacterium]